MILVSKKKTTRENPNNQLLVPHATICDLGLGRASLKKGNVDKKHAMFHHFTFWYFSIWNIFIP